MIVAPAKYENLNLAMRAPSPGRTNAMTARLAQARSKRSIISIHLNRHTEVSRHPLYFIF